MQYDKNFKLQALRLSDDIGIKAVAENLGVNYQTLSGQSKARKSQGGAAFVGSENRKIDALWNWRPNSAKRSTLTKFSKRCLFFRHEPKEIKAHAQFRFIDLNSDRWPIYLMCIVFGVSETGYYKYRIAQRKPSKDAFLSAEIQKILDKDVYNDNYGVECMVLVLAQKGITVGRRRATRIMCENGWLQFKEKNVNNITLVTFLGIVTVLMAFLILPHLLSAEQLTGIKNMSIIFCWSIR